MRSNTLSSFLFVLSLGIASIILFQIPQLSFLKNLGLQVIAPFQWALGSSFDLAGDFLQTVENVSELKEENIRLQADVDRLVEETVRLLELERENQLLREQLNLKRQQPAFEWIPAQIIGRDPSNLVQSITVNRGTGDGVKEGMTVVTPRGLVGRIVQASPVTAKVLLIFDVSSSVTAMIQNSRASGVVNGQRSEHLLMRYIPQAEPIRTGDKVITSGIGGVFPQGILIGQVKDVRQKDIELFQEALVEPAVDFKSLESVLVITNHLPLKID